MRKNFGELLNIQDLGNHSVGTVVELGILLASTTDVTPDPQRKHFYEVADDRNVYYIHVSPTSGTIFFLAVWENAIQTRPEPQLADAEIQYNRQ